MWSPPAVLTVLLLPGLASATGASCNSGPNVHGECACADQIFLNSDCSQGYYCTGAGEGCVLSCGPDEIILIDPRNGSSVLDYKCVSRADNPGICPGKMNTDCPCQEEGCEFGACQCAKQLWVSSDCKTAKFCNDRLPAENQEKTCPEGEIIDVSLVNQAWKCILDDGRCLNRSFHIGCPSAEPTPPPVTLCSYANNTLGKCECGKQLFINQDCTEGFFCMDGTFPDGVVADGCRKKCEKDEILIVNVAQNSWDCVPKAYRPGVLPLICPGKFNIECPGNGDIGECECDGQLWINENCREGFYCDSKVAGGGRDIKCEEDERIDVDMVHKTWKCIKDDGQCPGGFHVGCESDPTTTVTSVATTTTKPPVTICSYANNTLGTCECGKQLFINEDCTEGFFCMDGTFPDGVVADGCRKKCEKDEVLIVNVAQNSWNCVPKSVRPGVLPLICPGKFNIECPGNGDIGECECDGQLWINENCREGFYCDSKVAGGGRDIKCEEDERIDVDMVNKTWKCIKDDGQCPGGFHVGCESDPTTTVTSVATTTTKPPVTICSYANNTLGTCECGKQLFINEDCTEGFFCMDGTFPSGVVADGCRKKCEKDEVLIVNVAQNSWNCVPKSVRPGVLPLICPGKFNIECPGNGDIGECECDGQLWINENCREGFYCNSNFAGGGQDIKCEEDQRIEVNMVDKTWKCIQDDGQCPGGFHVGCESDPTTTTPGPNSADFRKASGVLLVLAMIILIVV